MADGFGYGGFGGLPYPVWLSSPSPHPSASAPPFLATHPVESYEQSQGVFDPMTSHGSYYRSPADWSNYPSYGDNSRSQTTPSSIYADNSRPGNFGPRGEDSYKDMYSPGGYYLPYNSASSATVSSLSDMLIRNSQEPFYKPIPPSGVYAFDENRPGHYQPATMNAVSGPPVEPCARVPSLPTPSLKTEALFDESQAGIRLGDGRSFGDGYYHPLANIQSSLRGSSVEPVNFDVLLGYGEATGDVKPSSENPDLPDGTVASTGSKTPRSSHPLQFNAKSSDPLFKEKGEGSGVSSLYQRPGTSVAESENGISQTSLKNAVDYCDEHRSLNHFVASSLGPSAPIMFSMGSESCSAMKADNGNAAQSVLNYKTPSESSALRPSEDVEASQKACKLHDELVDMMNREKKTTLLTDLGVNGSSRSNTDDVSTGQSPERHLCDQGDFPSPASSPRVSSVVNAMHNLSEVLVYECFNNGSWLEPGQLENLDRVLENLTKCLKKSTCSKTKTAEASVPTQAMHISCPSVVDLNEVPNVVAKDCQGFNVKAVDNFGFNDLVDKDKNEMTQSIKNILASNFPDGEENHPQTLLYKNLWLETEAALCSTTCMARYHRIQNETGNLKSQNREISADASTCIQEPFLNPQKSISIINNVEQETTESLIKHGSNCGNNVVTMSHDAPQSSKFNSDSLEAVLSLLSRSLPGSLGQENHGNVDPDAQTPNTIQQESHASTTEEKHNDVIDRFQILKLQETNRKLKSQNFAETRMGDQEENPEASEMATIVRSSHMSDVMDRFQILKRREAEQVQKSLKSLDADSESESESDSDDDQPRNRTQICDHLWSDSMITVRGNSQIGTCADTEEPSASGNGYESLASDWEHVLKDD